MFGNVMTQAYDDALFISFCLAINLLMICSGRKVLYPMNLQNVSKNLLTNCRALSIRRKAGILYGSSQWSKKIGATCNAVVFNDLIGIANFVYRSVLTMINWFPVIDFGSGPNISMVLSSNDFLDQNGFGRHFLLRQVRFLVRSWHSVTVLQTSVAMCSQ